MTRISAQKTSKWHVAWSGIHVRHRESGIRVARSTWTAHCQNRQQIHAIPINCPSGVEATLCAARDKAGKYGESLIKAQLFIHDKVVAEGPMCTQTGHFTFCGDGLCIGYDSADNVREEYQSPGTFTTGGTILSVAIDVSQKAYLDLEREAAGAFLYRDAGKNPRPLD